MIKMIHTSDWHLGKKLDAKSRLAEQKDVLEELVAVCNAENIDVVVIAGDIFDTVNPPAEAEELFYSFALRLAQGRMLIAIAGNHDNAERLRAPSGIASACNIALVGGMDLTGYHRHTAAFTVTGGEGYLRIEKGNDCLSLALLAYPSSARMSGLGYKEHESGYAASVKEWLGICAKVFDLPTKMEHHYKVAVSHLFMQNSTKGDEYELGTASLLPVDILPNEAHYTALGHVHKPQKVSGERNAYYSGSILKYSYDDTTNKFFNVISFDKNSTKVIKIPIQSGRSPLKLEVKSFEEIEPLLLEHATHWIQIHYNCSEPLSASKMAKLRSYENFTGLINVYKAQNAPVATKRHKTDVQLFKDFYFKQFKEQPSDDLTDMFLKAMSGEEF